MHARHKKEHEHMLAIRNTLNGARSSDSGQINQLKTTNTRLKAEKKDLNKLIGSLKTDIAYYLTQFDIADGNYRVFTCSHEHLSNVPDGNHSTQEKQPRHIAKSFFLDWAHDAEFLEKYGNHRQYLLDHHRAHQAAHQGRGNHSSELYNWLTQIDASRGTPVTYS